MPLCWQNNILWLYSEFSLLVRSMQILKYFNFFSNQNYHFPGYYCFPGQNLCPTMHISSVESWNYIFKIFLNERIWKFKGFSKFWILQRKFHASIEKAMIEGFARIKEAVGTMLVCNNDSVWLHNMVCTLQSKCVEWRCMYIQAVRTILSGSINRYKYTIIN